MRGDHQLASAQMVLKVRLRADSNARQRHGQAHAAYPDSRPIEPSTCTESSRPMSWRACSRHGVCWGDGSAARGPCARCSLGSLVDSSHTFTPLLGAIKPFGPMCRGVP
jgi:hypothetical protein